MAKKETKQSFTMRIGTDMMKGLDRLVEETDTTRSRVIRHALCAYMIMRMDDDYHHSIQVFREVVMGQSGVDPYVMASWLFVKWHKAVKGEKGYSFVLFDLGEKRRFWIVKGPLDTPAVIETWKQKMFQYIKNIEKLGIFEEKRDVIKGLNYDKNSE